MNPIEYTIKQIDTNVFTFTEISDTLLGFTNTGYSGEIDLDNLIISFVKGSETFFLNYNDDDFSIQLDNLTLFLDNDINFRELLKILNVQKNIDRGVYNDCLE